MKQPNVVFIISDDTKHKWLSSYQGKPECQPIPELRVPTPNIDRIASRGTRFDNAFCASATCQPSRYSYLTGRYAGSNPDPLFLSQYPRTRPASVEFNVYLNANIPSQGFLFRNAGYKTGFAGKWHASELGPEDRLPEIDPNAKPDAPGIDQKLRAHQKVLSENIKRNAGYDYAEGIVWCNNDPDPLKALDTHHIEWSVQKALDFLDTCSGDKPFLLHYASTCVHGPSALAAFEKDPHFTLGGRVDKVCDALPPRTGIVERLRKTGCKVNHQTASALWLDDQIGAILDKLEAMGVMDNTILVFCTDHGVESGKTTCYSRISPDVIDSPAHRAVALEAARKAIVLLQNRDRLLPLDKAALKRIAVIGPLADQIVKDKWYNGATSGDVAPLTGIREKVGAGVTVTYVQGCGLMGGSKEGALIAKAAGAARDADLALLFVGTTTDVEHETLDRKSLKLSGRQEELAKAVFAANPRTVVIEMSAGPLAVPWLKNNAPALLQAWWPGEEGGHAITDVLFGDVNPAGRLPHTVYASDEQVPSLDQYDISQGFTHMFLRGAPLFPFGHGLSYTEFKYANLRLSAEEIAADGALTVSVDVENTGSRAGDEVAQLYVRKTNSRVKRAMQELRGSRRLSLGPGEKKTWPSVSPARSSLIGTKQYKRLPRSPAITRSGSALHRPISASHRGSVSQRRSECWNNADIRPSQSDRKDRPVWSPGISLSTPHGRTAAVPSAS